ncbi:MAG: Gfo/Idh/MocA family oxidoreductase [Casimicrobiaceae bacterium]
MTDLKQRFGRPLRLGLIGGAPGTWIANIHRSAAELDGWWRTVAGVFSSDPGRSRAAGASLGIDPARSYGDVAEMLAAEGRRDDGIEAVAIVTPNDTHYRFSAAALDAGLDVVCDKPVTHTFAEACDLVARTHAGARRFAIAHAYSAYPMVRYAQRLVADGTLGPLRMAQVEYIQSGLATRVEDAPSNNRLRWLLDPGRSGLALVLSAIGCHAQQLMCFASGKPIVQLCADVQAIMPGRAVVDYVSALVELQGGVRGTFTVTQAAAGGENDIRLRLYGEKGMLDWSHRDASYLQLALQGEPMRTLGRGDPWLPPEILATGRIPRGHPEGLREAFANLYAEVAQERMCADLGEPAPSLPYPRIEDGAHTMAFIEACLASQASRAWVPVARLPGARS